MVDGHGLLAKKQIMLPINHWQNACELTQYFVDMIEVGPDNVRMYPDPRGMDHKVGDVILCQADSRPPPTIQWTVLVTPQQHVINGPTLTLAKDMAGPGVLVTCEACSMYFNASHCVNVNKTFNVQCKCTLIWRETFTRIAFFKRLATIWKRLVKWSNAHGADRLGREPPLRENNGLINNR